MARVNAECQRLLAHHIFHLDRPFHLAETRFTDQWSSLHNHDFFELFLVTRGTLEQVCNGRRDSLVANSLCLALPGDCHAFKADGPMDAAIVNLACTGEEFHRACGVLGLTPPSTGGTLVIPDTMLPLPQLQLRRLLDASSEHAVAHGRLLLLTLLGFFLANQADSAPPGWLVLACEQWNRPDLRRRGLPALVELAGKSPEHLSRVMRAHFGLTPTEYVNNARLQEAHRLITASHQGILEIALEVGFETLSHFEHLFRRRYGQSPRSLRRGGVPTVPQDRRR